MNDVYAINLAKSHLREGYNRADEEMVLSIYGDTFSDMSFGMPSFYDSDARDILRARLKRLFHDYHVEMAVIIIDIIPNGDKAMDWGWHVLKLTSKSSGKCLQVRTRYFETWKRHPVRGWLIASFIDNLDQGPRMPEDVIRDIESTDMAAYVTRAPIDV
jgi:ketosteroid isomerase-like protein